jgi:hypothetical protein
MIERAYVDKGYRGHDAQNPHRIFISGQKRGVFGAIKRELRRRSAIEPVIGHMKAEGHLGRCYPQGKRRRRSQRHPHRRRPQPAPRPRLVEDSFVPDHGRATACVHCPAQAQIGFLTAGKLFSGSGHHRKRFLNAAPVNKTHCAEVGD